MMRAFSALALLVALWAIDPVIASAMERHSELVDFSLSSWVWVVALGGGIALSFFAAFAVVALCWSGSRQDREQSE